MMPENNTIKKQNVPFTQIPNQLLEDKNISLKAKALFAFMYSKPDYWSFHTKGLKSQLREGNEAIISGLAELVKAGWIIRKEKREIGKFAGYEYFFNTTLAVKTEASHRLGVFRDGKTVNGNSVTEKPLHSNTIRSNTKEDSPKPKASDNIPSFSEFDLEISHLLYEHLKLIFSGMKKPNFNTWADHVRKIREIDGRSEESIRTIIKYIFEDDFKHIYDGMFWRSNVRSTESLRRQYETIALQINTAIQKSKAS